MFLELTVRAAGLELPGFSGEAGNGEPWADVGVSPAHGCCPLPSAAQHVWEQALHYHGSYDRLLRLLCCHIPGNQGRSSCGDSEVTGFSFALTQELCGAAYRVASVW